MKSNQPNSKAVRLTKGEESYEFPSIRLAAQFMGVELGRKAESCEAHIRIILNPETKQHTIGGHKVELI